MVEDRKLQKYINDLDKAYNGITIKSALLNLFTYLQKAIFPAKSLGGYDPSGFITGDALLKMFNGKASNSSQLMDVMPEINSKKLVRSIGIENSYGNFKELNSIYNDLSYFKRPKPLSEVKPNGDPVNPSSGT